MMITTESHRKSGLKAKNGLNAASEKITTHTKSFKKPTTSEVNTLIQMFNGGLLSESEKLALSLTQCYPSDGFGWKVLGAIYQQQSLNKEAYVALKNAASLLPKDSEVHYNLANYYYDQQQFAEAVSSYKKAISFSPNFAKAYYNLGSVLKEQGLLSEAEASYKKALKFDARNAQMNFNLALMLYEQGRFSEAATYYQQAIKVKPDFVSAHVNLGATFKALGKLREAEASYRNAINIEPNHADAHNNLGVVLKDLGNIADAEKSYRTAISINPEYVSAYNNLGILLKDAGLTSESEACYKQALKLDPLRAITHNNMAVLYRELGRLVDSEVCCRNAIKITPEYSDAYNNLGLALDSQGRFPEAEAAFEKALEIDPNSASVLSNFSVTLNTLSQLTRAESYLKRALEIAPQFVNAHINLCVNYLAQGRIQEAEKICIKALQIQPHNMGAQNNLLFSMNYSADYSAADCLEKARQYGEIVAAKVEKPYTTWQYQSPAKRLRVGLVSGDLRQHVVAYFLENFASHVDAAGIELIAYSTTNREDEVTARLKPHFSGWKLLVGLTDQAAAELIHNDNLHILLDLSGHSSGNRLPIFAWKPAPVQVSWLGYFATTGLAAMDYFIADKVGVPVENQANFVEKIKYLPDTRLCFTAPESDISVSTLPALGHQHITFGCFQNLAKVSDEVLDLWAEVLSVMPNSKLRWQCKSFRDDSVADELKQRMNLRGVDSDRLMLLGSVQRDAYFEAHHEVDLILDTFPFNGGTTTCEALWMGVPTLTLAGNTLIARQGASLLTAAGLADWVAESKSEYVNKALSFCADLTSLTKLRSGLRAQVLASPLFDGQRFAGNMENLLWEMWREHQGLDSKLNLKLADDKSVIRTHDNSDEIESLKLAVEVVSATRYSENDFWNKSALGLSLKRHLKQDARLSAKISYENTRGLSEVFNEAIDRADLDTTLVFIHDDVWIDEANFTDVIAQGLERFDIIGVAGNKRRIPNQPAWAFVDIQFTWDGKENLSGQIAHSKNAFGAVEFFGDAPAACELLDGVFLAAKKSSLDKNAVRFDKQFDFHFYDLDFCRTAKQAGLTLGTWLVGLTHQSAGNFGTQHWVEKFKSYLNKWEAPLANSLAVSSQDIGISIKQELQDAVNDVMEIALEHQSKGDTEQAEKLYLEILDILPKHPEANFNLGLIAASINDKQIALLRLEIAVQERPDNEQFWVGYIDALMKSGSMDSVTDALELGQQYGLSSDTAKCLAAEFVTELESKIALSQASASMSDIHIHQIYYSEQTKRENDIGYLGLDNLANLRPDWREYWPIRNYLLNNSLNENDYYGFFSPKFKAKTNLDAAAVHEFVRTHEDEADVFLFSPFFEQGAFFLNMFEQGMVAHQGIKSAFQGAIAKIAPSINMDTLVMDSRNIVFCNFIVAKPVFWKAWLESCEQLFYEAEEDKTELARSLNAGTNHDGGLAPNKVFVIERIASLILSTQRNWRVKVYDSKLLPCANPMLASYSHELIQMDEFKILSTLKNNSEYLTKFLQIRKQIQKEFDVKSNIPLQVKMDEMFQKALDLQQDGHIEHAEKLYLEVLNIQPKHAKASHNLGVIEAGLRGAEVALPRLELALQENPENEQFWVSYIDALMLTGASDTAAEALELGQRYGLKSETAQMLATEFVQMLESISDSKNVVKGALEKVSASDVGLITTLIPAYKSEYILELLTSLITQTYQNFKVIISDDSPNGEVTAIINRAQNDGLLKSLNFEIVTGPKKGGFPNIYNLVRCYASQSEFFHILMDDDLIYPTFYETHMREHSLTRANLSVSARWNANQYGQPCGVIMDYQTSQYFKKTFNADSISKALIPNGNNKLGEWSHAVFRKEAADSILHPDINQVSYFGLDDIGSFIKATQDQPGIWISDILGIFRSNPNQNTGQLDNDTIKCAHYSWISLAIIAVENNYISEALAWNCISIIGNTIRIRYSSDKLGIEVISILNKHKQYSNNFKKEFMEIWNGYLKKIQIQEILDGDLSIRLT
jgi:protein O-GlcNAc transferase